MYRHSTWVEYWSWERRYNSCVFAHTRYITRTRARVTQTRRPEYKPSSFAEWMLRSQPLLVVAIALKAQNGRFVTSFVWQNFPKFLYSTIFTSKTLSAWKRKCSQVDINKLDMSFTNVLMMSHGAAQYLQKRSVFVSFLIAFLQYPNYLQVEPLKYSWFEISRISGDIKSRRLQFYSSPHLSIFVLLWACLATAETKYRIVSRESHDRPSWPTKRQSWSCCSVSTVSLHSLELLIICLLCIYRNW